MKFSTSLILIAIFPIFIGAAETTISGNTMELVDRGESVLFKGDVKLERGTDVIKADWMQTSKYKDKINAKGQVELQRFMPDGEKIKAFGDTAFFNSKSGEGYILGSRKKLSHVIYTQVVSSTASKTLDMYAKRFDFSENATTGTASGTVYGKSPDEESGMPYEFWSDQADLDNQSKSIRLTGIVQPKVKQAFPGGNRTITGDTIVYSYEAKKFQAQGRAQAVFVEIKKAESK